MEECRDERDSLTRVLESEQAKNVKLEASLAACKYNYNSLLQTCRHEVARKDSQIMELRKERDNMAFRRAGPAAKPRGRGGNQNRNTRLQPEVAPADPIPDLSIPPPNIQPPADVKSDTLIEPANDIESTVDTKPPPNATRSVEERRKEDRSASRGHSERSDSSEKSNHMGTSRTHSSSRRERSRDRCDRDRERSSSSRSTGDRSRKRNPSRDRDRSRHADRTTSRRSHSRDRHYDGSGHRTYRKRDRSRDDEDYKPPYPVKEENYRHGHVSRNKRSDANEPPRTVVREPTAKRPRKESARRPAEERTTPINEVRTNVKTEAESEDNSLEKCPRKEPTTDSSVVVLNPPPPPSISQIVPTTPPRPPPPPITPSDELSDPPPPVIPSEDVSVPPPPLPPVNPSIERSTPPSPPPSETPPPQPAPQSLESSTCDNSKAEKRPQPLMTSFTGSLERSAKEGLFIQINTDRTTTISGNAHSEEEPPKEELPVNNSQDAEELAQALASITPAEESPMEALPPLIDLPTNENIPIEVDPSIATESTLTNADQQPNHEELLCPTAPVPLLPLHPHMMPVQNNLPMMIIPRQAVPEPLPETIEKSPSPVPLSPPPKIVIPKMNTLAGYPTAKTVRDKTKKKEKKESDLTVANLDKYNTDMEKGTLEYIKEEIARIGGPDIANDLQLLQSFTVEEEKRRLAELKQSKEVNGTSTVAESLRNEDICVVKKEGVEMDNSKTQGNVTAVADKSLVMGHALYNFSQDVDGTPILSVSRLKKKKRNKSANPATLNHSGN